MQPVLIPDTCLRVCCKYQVAEINSSIAHSLGKNHFQTQKTYKYQAGFLLDRVTCKYFDVNLFL